MLRNLSMFKKLVLLMGISILTIGIIQLNGYITIKSLEKNTEDIFTNRLEPSLVLTQYRINNRVITSDMYLSFF